MGGQFCFLKESQRKFFRYFSSLEPLLLCAYRQLEKKVCFAFIDFFDAKAAEVCAGPRWYLSPVATSVCYLFLGRRQRQ